MSNHEYEEVYYRNRKFTPWTGPRLMCIRAYMVTVPHCKPLPNAELLKVIGTEGSMMCTYRHAGDDELTGGPYYHSTHKEMLEAGMRLMSREYVYRHVFMEETGDIFVQRHQECQTEYFDFYHSPDWPESEDQERYKELIARREAYVKWIFERRQEREQLVKA